MRDLLASLQEQLYKQEITEVILPLIEITHSTFDAPIRLVANNENITSNGEEFQWYPFQIQFPDDKEEISSPAQLVIDNISKFIGIALEGLAIDNSEAKVTCWLVLASDPDNRQLYLQEMTVQDVDVDQQVVSMVLANNPIWDELCPADEFTPGTAPGLFK